MKKIIVLLSVFFMLFLASNLISCESEECVHKFKPATCISPKICVLCEETTGALGGHAWEGASCITPKTCKICSLTSGEALGHSWAFPYCTNDSNCRVCNEKKFAKEHTWNTDKCLELQICTECGFEGEIVEHNWTKATCVSAETCISCGETKGKELGHDWKFISCEEPKICQRCSESIATGLSHQWEYMGCDKERECSICSQGEGFEFGHRWIEATCALAEHCENCKITVGSPLEHNWEFKKTISPACEEGKEVYFCDGCDGEMEIGLNNPKYGYHLCYADGFCYQCNKQYNTSEMALEAVLIENEHSVECCGVFTSTETTAKIYKPITHSDIGIPVIDLGGELPSSKGYTNVIDFTYDSEGLSFACTAEIKVQGASSAGKPKKNFNIKLLKADGSKNKVELVDGWGKENKYCMKANYIDYSQSRNVVSGKIFGEIVKSRNDELSNTPNGGAIDGFPILVYNDGVYQGIYTMNIPKDKWMFDMHDSDEKNQAIFMAETWNNAVSFRQISTSGFVLEYASNEDSLIDNKTQWAYDSLLDLIEFVYYNDGEDFKKGIHQYADIDKCIDSMLYTFFICADDNTSKNILWVTLDGKVWFSSMYDMDGTWGMRWNGNIEFDEYTHPISALVDGKGLAPERNHSNLNLLWERIYVNYYDRVCQRYLELRQEILTIENITYHFEAFFDAIPDVLREAEKQKWTGVPSQKINHLEQILTFAEKRLVVMDEILLSKS